MVKETAEANRDTSFLTISTERHVPARSSILLTSTADRQDVSKSFVTPEMMKPYPKAAPRKCIRRGHQPGKTKN